ncbi:helix-turn-helix domain-containing protein [Kineococcus glutinatus]|uniref:HTH tetR-type domain-containing protein n=1 Tax=Kineococcus glutinatus TaxID=1070872 RepID=A0ABP9HYI4_9ACTN
MRTAAAPEAASPPGDRTTDRIADRVFFARPPALPRGRHDLDPAQVAAAQRERMMIAATELMAAGGYRGTGVREICARAAVSRAAFYECFADKDECISAAHDRFIAVLGDTLAAAPGGRDWPACVTGLLRSYLGLLQRDLVTARAFLVETDALGRPARRRRREAALRLALLLHRRREGLPGGGRVPLSAHVGAVYAVRQITCDALDDDAPDLPALLPELAGWLAAMTGSSGPGDGRDDGLGDGPGDGPGGGGR